MEAVINSRPLTYLYSDNVNQALTLAHLIYWKRLLTLPDSIVYPREEEDTPELLNKRMKYLITFQNKFWQRWQSQYLSELREQHKERNNKGSKSMNREIQEGELVTIQEDSLPKGQWRMGLVEQLLRGQDGVIRGAEEKPFTTPCYKALPVRGKT